MPSIGHHFASFALATAALMGTALPPAHAQAPDGSSFNGLAGRWTGTGLVTWKNGRQEPYACVVTYYLTEGGSAVKQLLRCQDGRSPDMKIDLRTAMKVVKGTQLIGRWEDRLYSLEGDVAGHVTATGFEANASHPLFNAALQIEMAGTCDQSVVIRPSRDIEVIHARLSKC